MLAISSVRKSLLGRGIGALALWLCATGCQGTLYSATGDLMSAYAVDHLVPTLMASSDVGMACEAGVSMGGFLTSFARVGAATDRAALISEMSAAMCAEAEAWKAELRRLRALHSGLASEAADAHSQVQRAQALAARRYARAYARTHTAFTWADADADVGEKSAACPRWKDDVDPLLWVLGQSSGLLAALNDRASGGEAGVDLAVLPAIDKAARCLPEDSLWGVPKALQAAVALALPSSAHNERKAWQRMEAAMALGDAMGVRLARAFWLQLRAARGDESAVRDGISAHARALKARPADPDFRLLDAYATQMIRHESDKIWTRERGHRTPSLALGTFWQPPMDTADDGLLDDLLP